MSVSDYSGPVSPSSSVASVGTTSTSKRSRRTRGSKAEEVGPPKLKTAEDDKKTLGELLSEQYMEIKDLHAISYIKRKAGEWDYHQSIDRRRLERIVQQDIAEHVLEQPRPVPRSRAICGWKHKAASGMLLLCNNRCIRSPVTGKLLFRCGWHCDACAEEHAGKPAKVDPINQDGLCSMHYIAKYGKPPDEIEDPLHVEGVVVGMYTSSKHPLRPKAGGGDPYQAQPGLQRARAEGYDDPSLADLELEQDVFDRIGQWVTRGMVETGMLRGKVLRGITRAQATFRMLGVRRAYLRYRREQDAAERDRAVRRLQLVYRGKRVIEEMRALRLARQLAVRVVQRNWRYARWRRRAEYEIKVKRAAMRIQRWIRRRWLMYTFVTMRQRLRARIVGLAEARSRIMVSNVILGWLARHRYRKLRLLDARRKMAARVMQKAVRQWLGRLHKDAVLEELKKKESQAKTATELQRWWRKYTHKRLASSVIHLYRAKIVRIYAACRGFLGRAKAKRARRRNGEVWRWLDASIPVGKIRTELGLQSPGEAAKALKREAIAKAGGGMFHATGKQEDCSTWPGASKQLVRGDLLSKEDEIEVALVDVAVTLAAAEPANTGLLHPTAFRRVLRQCGIPAKTASALQKKHHEVRTDRSNWHELVRWLFDDTSRDQGLIRFLVGESRVGGRLNGQRPRIRPEEGHFLHPVLELTRDGTLPQPQPWVAGADMYKRDSGRTKDPIEETEAVVDVPGVGQVALEACEPDALEIGASKRDRLQTLRQRSKAMKSYLQLAEMESGKLAGQTCRRVRHMGKKGSPAAWKHDRKDYQRVVNGALAISNGDVNIVGETARRGEAGQGSIAPISAGNASSSTRRVEARLDPYGTAMLGALDDESRKVAEYALLRRDKRRNSHAADTVDSLEDQAATSSTVQYNQALTRITTDVMTMCKDYAKQSKPTAILAGVGPYRRSGGTVAVLDGDFSLVQDEGSLVATLALRLAKGGGELVHRSPPQEVIQMLMHYNAFFEKHWAAVVTAVRTGAVPDHLDMPSGLRAKVHRMLQPCGDAADRLETILRSLGFVQRASLRQTQARMSYAMQKPSIGSDSAVSLMMPKRLPRLMPDEPRDPPCGHYGPGERNRGYVSATSRLVDTVASLSRMSAGSSVGLPAVHQGAAAGHGSSKEGAEKPESSLMDVAVFTPGLELEQLHAKTAGLGALAARAERSARGIRSGQLLQTGEGGAGHAALDPSRDEGASSFYEQYKKERSDARLRYQHWRVEGEAHGLDFSRVGGSMQPAAPFHQAASASPSPAARSHGVPRWMSVSFLGQEFPTPPFKPDNRIDLPACSKHQWMCPSDTCQSCRQYRLLPLPQPPVSFYPGLCLRDMRVDGHGGSGLNVAVASGMLSKELAELRGGFGRAAFRGELWRSMRDAVVVGDGDGGPPIVLTVLAVCRDKNGATWVIGQRLWFYPEVAAVHGGWPRNVGLHREHCLLGRRILYVKVGRKILGQAICLNEMPRFAPDPVPDFDAIVKVSGLPAVNCFRFGQQIRRDVESLLLQDGV